MKRFSLSAILLLLCSYLLLGCGDPTPMPPSSDPSREFECVLHKLYIDDQLKYTNEDAVSDSIWDCWALPTPSYVYVWF